ncbi:biotin synthase BioB [Singulisphaera sp. PoT]|uniref:biotin synthase BioB n=1 Tax=Singulisphaera sp. PoT TaxID=3411797 RepID=UPI003BF572B1
MSISTSSPSRAEVAAIYRTPVLDLIFRAAEIHRQYHDPSHVQVCVLLSVKTGGCPEDCGYCPQAARYHTDVKAKPLMDVDDVLAAAKRAKDEGATRFCMGAAWREVRDNEHFDRILEMVRGVKDLELEACCTLGMLNPSQARRLKEAGLDAYNHNLDSSEEFYGEVISTRTYQDRLNTLQNVREAGISVCCGGIVGMGETEDDRIGLLHTLASMPEPPESVPINALVAVEGTPLAEQPKVAIWDMLRTIATARILMPQSMVRLSAGRVHMSETDQALCFLAGANSIFAGDKLLTTPNPGPDRDQLLFNQLGLKPKPLVVESSECDGH